MGSGGLWSPTKMHGHFCYILPKEKNTDPIQLVVPTCLQMGWCEAPPLFCTASKMAWDIAQELLDNNQPLSPHPLEHYCIPNSVSLPHLPSPTIAQINHLLEVYMDDFLGWTQDPFHHKLLHFTKAELHGIHSIFPPPAPNKNQTDKPISIKKLKQRDVCGVHEMKSWDGYLMDPHDALTFQMTK